MHTRPVRGNFPDAAVPRWNHLDDPGGVEAAGAPPSFPRQSVTTTGNGNHLRGLSETALSQGSPGEANGEAQRPVGAVRQRCLGTSTTERLCERHRCVARPKFKRLFTCCETCFTGETM